MAAPSSLSASPGAQKLVMFLLLGLLQLAVISLADLAQCPGITVSPDDLDTVAVWTDGVISRVAIARPSETATPSSVTAKTASVAKCSSECSFPLLTYVTSVGSQSSFLHIQEPLSFLVPGYFSRFPTNESIRCVPYEGFCGATIPLFRHYRVTAFGVQHAYSFSPDVSYQDFYMEGNPICYFWQNGLASDPAATVGELNNVPDSDLVALNNYDNNAIGSMHDHYATTLTAVPGYTELSPLGKVATNLSAVCDEMIPLVQFVDNQTGAFARLDHKLVVESQESNRLFEQYNPTGERFFCVARPVCGASLPLWKMFDYVNLDSIMATTPTTTPNAYLYPNAPLCYIWEMDYSFDGVTGAVTTTSGEIIGNSTAETTTNPPIIENNSTLEGSTTVESSTTMEIGSTTTLAGITTPSGEIVGNSTSETTTNSPIIENNSTLVGSTTVESFTTMEMGSTTFEGITAGNLTESSTTMSSLTERTTIIGENSTSTLENSSTTAASPLNSTAFNPAVTTEGTSGTTPLGTTIEGSLATTISSLETTRTSQMAETSSSPEGTMGTTVTQLGTTGIGSETTSGITPGGSTVLPGEATTLSGTTTPHEGSTGTTVTGIMEMTTVSQGTTASGSGQMTTDGATGSESTVIPSSPAHEPVETSTVSLLGTTTLSGATAPWEGTGTTMGLAATTATVSQNVTEAGPETISTGYSVSPTGGVSSGSTPSLTLPPAFSIGTTGRSTPPTWDSLFPSSTTRMPASAAADATQMVTTVTGRSTMVNFTTAPAGTTVMGEEMNPVTTGITSGTTVTSEVETMGPMTTAVILGTTVIAGEGTIAPVGTTMSSGETIVTSIPWFNATRGPVETELPTVPSEIGTMGPVATTVPATTVGPAAPATTATSLPFINITENVKTTMGPAATVAADPPAATTVSTKNLPVISTVPNEEILTTMVPTGPISMTSAVPIHSETLLPTEEPLPYTVVTLPEATLPPILTTIATFVRNATNVTIPGWMTGGAVTKAAGMMTTLPVIVEQPAATVHGIESVSAPAHDVTETPIALETSTHHPVQDSTDLFSLNG